MSTRLHLTKNVDGPWLKGVDTPLVYTPQIVYT